MKSFRGQAALEFMMTYGWAILVVLAAIGALSYFGILNPAKFTPDTCLASSGFACPGKPILNSTTLAFSIVNGQGYDIQLDPDAVELTGGYADCSTDNDNIEFCTQGEASDDGVADCVVNDGIPSNPADDATYFSFKDGTGVTVHLDDCTTAFDAVQVAKGEVKITYKNRQSGLSETLTIAVTGKPAK